MTEPTKRAIVAFLFHGPGLRMFTSYRFSRSLVRTNVVAIAITLIVTALAGSVFLEHRALAALVAFTTGHFAWSAYLARHVYRAPA
jgi:hypothetical protein